MKLSFSKNKLSKKSVLDLISELEKILMSFEYGEKQVTVDIKEFQKSAREKYSFLNPFNQTKPLKNYLNLYKEKTKK